MSLISAARRDNGTHHLLAPDHYNGAQVLGTSPCHLSRLKIRTYGPVRSHNLDYN